MIKIICKWTLPCDNIPQNAFATLEVKTNKLMEYSNTFISDTTYYPVVEGYLGYNKSLPYQRCVNLFFVDCCITEMSDDLEKYGFKLIGYENSGKQWCRQN